MDSAPLTVLAVGAHPDDVEITCGGTVARLAREGHAVGILDLTHGELGSRGTPMSRDTEAADAAKVLGVAVRRNAGLPDGGLEPASPEQRLAVVRLLRQLRPACVLVPWTETRHPDHARAATLVLEACFYAGLHKLDAGDLAPFRPALVLHYMERFAFEPTLIVDVSADHATKLRAIRAFRSQFERRAEDGEPATFLTRPEFLASIEARDRHYGELGGFAAGEPFRARGPLPVRDLAALVGQAAGRQT